MTETTTMTDEQMAAALLAKRNELRAAIDRNTAALALLQQARRAADVSESDVQAARNGLMALADCADGKMPLDKWVALLVKTLRSLRTDFAADGYPTVAYVPTIDAVLKMVPKVAERRSEVTAEQVAP